MLISRDADSESDIALPHRDEYDELIPVPVGHLIAAAEKMVETLGHAAQRLARLGYLVSPRYFELGRPEPGDRLLASRYLMGEWPWLDGDQVVPLGHLATGAERCGRTLAETALRLEQLGFRVPALPAQDAQPVEPADLVLMSRNLAMFPPPEEMVRIREYGWWLPQEEPVPIWNVVAGAVQTGQTIEQVMNRLRRLGFTLPELPPMPPIEGLTT